MRWHLNLFINIIYSQYVIFIFQTSNLSVVQSSLDNAGTQPKFQPKCELGYDAAKIAEGKALLAQTRAAYDANITEDDETTVAYALFTSKKEELTKIYMHHRKKAKVVFRKDSLIADKLAVLGEMPRTYVNLLEAAAKFYETSMSKYRYSK